MNRKTSLVLVLIAATATGGWWTWRAIRHARLDLVTLHARDLPLVDALRRLERQTGERLLADSRLTNGPPLQLDLDDAPLNEALDRIAEQTGGFWRTTFAVHHAPAAAVRLATLLRDGRDPLQAGWTNLAGALPPPSTPGDGTVFDGPVGLADGGDAGGPRRLMGGGGGGGGHKVMVLRREESSGPPNPSGPDHPGSGTLDVDVFRPGPGGGSSPGGPHDGGATRRVVVSGRVSRPDGEGGVLEFDLTPERLLLEQDLVARLKRETLDDPPGPSDAGARRLAASVRGKWSKFRILEPSPLGDLPVEIRRAFRGDPPPGGEGAPGSGDPLSRAEGEIRRGQFDRLERLTPEQRARQSRRSSSTSSAHAPFTPPQP